MTGSATLVLGAAIGYDERQMTPFLASLRRSGYRGDVALLVDRATARACRERPLFAGVELVPVSPWPPQRFAWLQRGDALRRWWEPAQRFLWRAARLAGRLPLPRSWRRTLQLTLAQQVCPPTLSRYFRYYRFLRRRAYARVLLSDVRDVIFQRDPFLDLPRAGLAASIEPPAYTVGSEHYNAMWVRLAYGQGMLDRIGAQPVSCSGVTYGDGTAIAGYLEQMVGAMLDLPLEAAGLGGVDQGVHNVLLWTGRVGAFQRLETLASPVATLNAVDDEALRLAPGGELLNRDGTIPSVLHQYDRSARLRAHFGHAP